MGSEDREYSYNPREWDYDRSRHRQVIKSVLGKMPYGSENIYFLNEIQSQEYFRATGKHQPKGTPTAALAYANDPDKKRLVSRIIGQNVEETGILQFNNTNVLDLAHEMTHLKQFEEKPYYVDNFYLCEALAEAVAMAVYIKLDPYGSSFRRFYRISNSESWNHSNNSEVDLYNHGSSSDNPYRLQLVWDILVHYLREKYTAETVQKLNSEDMKEVERRIIADINRNGKRR